MSPRARYCRYTNCFWGGGGAFILTLLVTGCGSGGSEAEVKLPDPKAGTNLSAGLLPKNPEQVLRPGTRGGLIFPVGVDRYNLEAVFKKDGTVQLHMLAKDGKLTQEVEEQTIKAYARPLSAFESKEFILKAKPHAGNSPGKTNLFEGTLPVGMEGKMVDVSIPYFSVNGENFRLGIQSKSESALPK